MIGIKNFKLLTNKTPKTNLTNSKQFINLISLTFMISR
jgi:hypothetical protein